MTLESDREPKNEDAAAALPALRFDWRRARRSGQFVSRDHEKIECHDRAPYVAFERR